MSTSFEAEHGPWSRGLVVAFDTETTGVDVASARIVTAALVCRRLAAPTDPETRGESTPFAGAEVQRWLLDPGMEIPAAASAVHGISTEYARAQGTEARRGIGQIAAALTDQVRSGRPIVAFNAAYDLRLLASELRRHDLPSLADRADGAPVHVIDPLVLDRALNRYRKGKRTLGALCESYAVDVPASLHSADADAAVTLALLDRMLAQHPQVTAQSLDELSGFQREAHREWASQFNSWRSSRGYSGEPADESWP